MKIRFIFVLALVIPFLINCGGGLSENEARKIISEDFKNNGFVQSEISVKNTTGIQGLIQEGYLIATEEGSISFMGHNTVYKFGPTQKGKQYANKDGLFPNGTIVANNVWGTSATFRGAVRKRSITKINEIKIDKQTNTATVTYVVGYDAVEPYYTAICPGNESAECNYSATETKTVKFKRGDKGWSVIKEQKAETQEATPAQIQESTTSASSTSEQNQQNINQQITFSPSFDCAKVSSGPERMICSNKDLSEADVKLAQIFRNALSKTKNKASLKREQAQWIKNNRDACSDSTAMLKVYQDRIAQLSGK